MVTMVDIDNPHKSDIARDDWALLFDGSKVNGSKAAIVVPLVTRILENRLLHAVIISDRLLLSDCLQPSQRSIELLTETPNKITKEIMLFIFIVFPEKNNPIKEPANAGGIDTKKRKGKPKDSN